MKPVTAKGSKGCSPGISNPMETKRNTLQRQLIFNAIQELDCHATAEEVYDHVVKEHPALSKATVYRNLSRMAEAGELLNIGNLLGAVHYDHNLFKHHHFICEACGTVFDVMKAFPEIDEPLAEMEGFTIRGRNLTFSGLCPECTRKRDTAASESDTVATG